MLGCPVGQFLLLSLSNKHDGDGGTGRKAAIVVEQTHSTFDRQTDDGRCGLDLRQFIARSTTINAATVGAGRTDGRTTPVRPLHDNRPHMFTARPDKKSRGRNSQKFLVTSIMY